jgi:hypothetical protein
VGSFTTSNEGPYHCPECTRKFDLSGTTDITLDSNVMQWVCTGTIPRGESYEERERCRRIG